MSDDPAMADLSVDALIALLADAAAGKRVAELVQVGVELGRRLERVGLHGEELDGYARGYADGLARQPVGGPLRVAPAMVEAAVAELPAPAGQSRARRTRPIRCPVCENTTLGDDGHLTHASDCTSELVAAPRPDLGIGRGQLPYQPRIGQSRAYRGRS